MISFDPSERPTLEQIFESEWMKEIRLMNKEQFNKQFVSEFFDIEKINNMLDDHHNDIKPNTRKIFTIYCFLIWYERYFILEK